MKTIEIIITPQGKSSLQTLGFVGASCRQASQFLEKALGQRISEKLTAKFHQSQLTQQHQQEHC